MHLSLDRDETMDAIIDFFKYILNSEEIIRTGGGFKSEKSRNLIYAFIATNWCLEDLGSYEDFYCILIKEKPLYQNDFDLIKDNYFDFMERLLAKEKIKQF